MKNKKERKVTVLVMIGIGGSGKSTLANKLIGYRGVMNSLYDTHGVDNTKRLKYISSGDVYRANICGKLSLSEREIDAEFIEKHGISKYNDEIESCIYEQLTAAIKDKVSVILDGYPRNIDQLQRLFKLNQHVDFIFVYLDTSIMVAHNRIKDRGRADFNEDKVLNLLKTQKKNIDQMIHFLIDYEEETGIAISRLKIMAIDEVSLDAVCKIVDQMFYLSQETYTTIS